MATAKETIQKEGNRWEELLIPINVRMTNNLKGGVGEFKERGGTRIQTLCGMGNNQRELCKFASE